MYPSHRLAARSFSLLLVRGSQGSTDKLEKGGIWKKQVFSGSGGFLKMLASYNQICTLSQWLGLWRVKGAMGGATAHE